MWVHQIDPFAIQITEAIGIRWYGLSYLFGLLFGYYLIRYMAQKKRIALNAEQVGDFITICAVGVMLGGRFGYCLFYKPDLLLEWGSAFPFWGALAIHKGGMSSHGGLGGLMLACCYYGYKNKISMKHLIDLTALAATLGMFFGRLANFVNGELYGRVADGVAWSVKFPQEMYRWLEQAQWAKLKTLGPLMDQLGTVVVASGEKLQVSQLKWYQWLENFAEHHRQVDQVITSLVAATQKGNEQVVTYLGNVLTARHPSQIYQGLMEGLLVFLILIFIWRKPQKPGVITGWGGVFYSIMRIAGEQFRLPDAHLGYRLFDLTRGQWLSVFSLVFFLALLIYSYRQDEKPLGGFSDSPPPI